MSTEVTKLKSDGAYGLRFVLLSGRHVVVEDLMSLSPAQRKSARLARVRVEKAPVK